MVPNVGSQLQFYHTKFQQLRKQTNKQTNKTKQNKQKQKQKLNKTNKLFNDKVMILQI